MGKRFILSIPFYFIIFLLFLALNHEIYLTITDCSLSKYKKEIAKYFRNNTDLTEREINFDEDVLALMHIQKTAGSFLEESIKSNLIIKTQNQEWMDACIYIDAYKRKICYRNRHFKAFFWDRYVSHYCDIHADYTELKNCILQEYANRLKISDSVTPFQGTIHFITMLRDPIQRYISEFRHVKRGAIWEKSVRVCNKEILYTKNCSSSQNWTHATWQEYLTCDYNLANNRMTRMLVNYNQFGCRVLRCWTKEGNCTSEEKRLHDKVLLESAKQTLASFSFFGLAEYQSLSQYLFEKTFKNKTKFSKNLVNLNTNQDKYDDELKNLELIRQNNHLDIELYEFAKHLFFKRIEYFKSRDK